jgi:hypothetical protein
MNRSGNKAESVGGNFVASDDWRLFFEVPFSYSHYPSRSDRRPKRLRGSRSIWPAKRIEHKTCIVIAVDVLARTVGRCCLDRSCRMLRKLTSVPSGKTVLHLRYGYLRECCGALQSVRRFRRGASAIVAGRCLLSSAMWARFGRRGREHGRIEFVGTRF